MEPHCRCHVRAASCLLLEAVVILFFVSATTFCHARLDDDMSSVMDILKRFKEAPAYYSKARVGMHLVQRCYISARSMRQLCACAANRGDQRRGNEFFKATPGTHLYNSCPG